MGTVYDIPNIAGLYNGTYEGNNPTGNILYSINAVRSSGLLLVTRSDTRYNTLAYASIACNFNGYKLAAYPYTDEGGIGYGITLVLSGSTIGFRYYTAYTPDSNGNYYEVGYYFRDTSTSFYYTDVAMQDPSSSPRFINGTTSLDLFNSKEEAENALMGTATIMYRLTNCTAPSAPTEAVIGSTVTVPLAFPEGYGVVNPSSDAYVTCNGIVIPSTYSNGQLVFTMPDPS